MSCAVWFGWVPGVRLGLCGPCGELAGVIWWGRVVWLWLGVLLWWLWRIS